MSKDFNFVEDDAKRVQQHQVQPKGIIGFLMKKGIAKTEAQANIYLIITIIICVAIIIYNNLS